MTLSNQVMLSLGFVLERYDREGKPRAAMIEVQFWLKKIIWMLRLFSPNWSHDFKFNDSIKNPKIKIEPNPNLKKKKH